MMIDQMSVDDSAYLVVGGDGLVGSYLTCYLESIGQRNFSTTRRSQHGSTNRLFLDLAVGCVPNFVMRKFACAFICAGITNMAVCESEPNQTHQVNVINTVRLAQALHNAGTPVIFLSSNTVFNGMADRPNEDAPYSYSTAYGRQKAEAEQAILKLGSGAAVIRITKVLAVNSGVTKTFLTSLSADEPCRAFDDLRMSPISLSYLCKSLANLAANNLSGIYHLSGENEMSYAAFALMLANKIGKDKNLIRSSSSEFGNVPVLFRPAHPALGMARSLAERGLFPEPISEMLSRLLTNYG